MVDFLRKILKRTARAPASYRSSWAGIKKPPGNSMFKVDIGNIIGDRQVGMDSPSQ